MAELLMLRGPGAGRRFPLEDQQTIIGRQPGVAIYVDLPDVSRRHAQITRDHDGFFLEDLGSRYGTFVNGQQITGKVALRPQSQLLIGGCEFLFEEPPPLSETGVVIRAELSTKRGNLELFQQDAGSKLKAEIAIANHLAQTRDLYD